jgi:uncharacterized protein (TIGR02118 family)
MAKFVYVLKRRPELSLEEFQRYWRENHGPLVKSFAATLGIKRYVQVHTRPPQAPRGTDPLRGDMAEPYDGVAELWFDPALATGTEDERRAARRALAEDEAKFIDFSHSAMWTGEELFVIGD